MTNLCLCTTLSREGTGDVDVKLDVIIYFKVDSFSPGYAATWDDPACGDEYEFSFVRAEIDGDDDEAPGPLTEAELAILRTWFEGQHEAAAEVAQEEGISGPDPDEARERRREYERGF